MNADRVKGCSYTSLDYQQLVDLGSINKVEISVQMLDTDAMRRLNHQYRDADKPTNVLSFQAGMPVLNDENTGALLVLGDIVFCPEIIAAEAMQQGKPCEQHWAHMIVHGTLHLCGYDHMTDDEAKAMESLEVQILSTLGISDPYLVRATP